MSDLIEDDDKPNADDQVWSDDAHGGDGDGDADEQGSGTGKSGKGEADGSFGGGKAGAGAGVGVILSTAKSEEVKSEHKHLTAGALVEAIVEFFSEWPMRASANLSVAWDKTKTNFKSFAIVNWVIEVGAQAVKDFLRTRQLRDSRGLQKQKSPTTTVGLGVGPTGQ